MHYRHHYHAGNYADVFKHVLLTGLLTALSRKDKPWAYLDSHAGAGHYDLGDPVADRTGEWRDGIGRLAGLPTDSPSMPAMLSAYLKLVRDGNADGGCRLYPGSPMLAQKLARAAVGDRLILCEKIEEVASEMERGFTLVGSTAIEDQLQDDVDGTIKFMREAGISRRSKMASHSAVLRVRTMLPRSS